MTKDFALILDRNTDKLLNSIRLTNASVDAYIQYDCNRNYTPKELEPYDALSDRFMRSVELALKFMRTYEKYMFAENSITIRDMLNRMEKIGVVSSTGIWIEMRDIRNRIVHEYTSESLNEIYQTIINFSNELFLLQSKVAEIKTQISLI